MNESDKNILSMIGWGAFALFVLVMCGYAVVYIAATVAIILFFTWPLLVIGGIIAAVVYLINNDKPTP